MILDFDPQDSAGKSEVARGVYQFRVTRIEPRQFGTGTRGFVAHFDVFLPDRVIKVYENMFYTPKALWKIEELCASTGAHYRKGMDSEELVGQSGRAFFGRKKNEKYLSLMEFIARSRPENGDGPPDAIEEPPPSVADEDVPF